MPPMCQESSRILRKCHGLVEDLQKIPHRQGPVTDGARRKELLDKSSIHTFIVPKWIYSYPPPRATTDMGNLCTRFRSVSVSTLTNSIVPDPIPPLGLQDVDDQLKAGLIEGFATPSQLL